MRVDVLGDVLVDGRPLVEITASADQRLVFAALAARYPAPVADDLLLELVWPGSVPEPRRLRLLVHRLRSSLTAAGHPAAIRRAGDGYALDGDVELDHIALTAALAGTEGATENETEVEGLVAALALWRGEPFHRYDVEPVAAGLVAALQRARRQGVTRLAERLLETGRAVEAVGPLEAIVIDDPFDEGVAELLVTALAAERGRAAALDRLRSLRATMVAELGPDASRALAHAERRLRSHDDDHDAVVDPDATADSPDTAATSPRAPAHHHRADAARPPAWRSSYLGRDADIAALAAAVGSTPLVTLVGPAGVGKTRLAVTVATRVAGDAAHFVDLAALSPDGDVDRHVATTLGLGSMGSGPRAALRSWLHNSDGLVVLDNCEHVAAGVAALLEDVLPSGRVANVLATSREPLRVDGERTVRLAPLPTDDRERRLAVAAQLLVERAGLDPDRLDEPDTSRARRLARQLDGLPLAIELAAARVRSMSLAELERRMDQRFSLLTAGLRAGPARHGTLRAAVEWSIDQLEPSERAVLARCAVFAGRFDHDDATAVCADIADAGSVQRALADLVDRSLVEFSDGPLPYRLLETFREWAREQSSVEATTHDRDRHARHFAAKVLGLAEAAWGPDAADAVDAVIRQAAEYRASVHHCLSTESWDVLADIIHGLGYSVFFMRGAFIDYSDWIVQLAEFTPDPIPPRWSTVANTISSRFNHLGLLEQHRRAVDFALRIAPDDPQCWTQAAMFHLPAGALDEATRCAEQAVRLARADQPSEVQPALFVRLSAAARRGDDVQRWYERLRNAARTTGHVGAEAWAELGIGRAVSVSRRDARHHAERARDLARSERILACAHMAAIDLALLQAGDHNAAAATLLELFAEPRYYADDIYVRRILGASAVIIRAAGDRTVGLSLARHVGHQMLPSLYRANHAVYGIDEVLGIRDLIDEVRALEPLFTPGVPIDQDMLVGVATQALSTLTEGGSASTVPGSSPSAG